MSNPPKMLTGPRMQLVIIGLLTVGFAAGGFQLGRHSVDASALTDRTATARNNPSADLSSGFDAPAPRQQKSVSIREIATMPFSEIYDALRGATRGQLMAWAADLERMPRGPRQRAAVAAYYKSLIQVDPSAAIQAVLRAKNLSMPDVAIADFGFHPLTRLD